GERIHEGGLLGWGGFEAFRVSVGNVGTWIIPLAVIPVAVLFITRASLHAISRSLFERLGVLSTGDRKPAGPKPVAPRLDPAVAADEPEEAPKLVVKPPPKPNAPPPPQPLPSHPTFPFVN